MVIFSREFLPERHVGRMVFLDMAVVTPCSRLAIIRPVTANVSHHLHFQQKSEQTLFDGFRELRVLFLHLPIASSGRVVGVFLRLFQAQN